MKIGDIFESAEGIMPQEALDLCVDNVSIQEVEPVEGFIDKVVVDEPPVFDEETGQVIKVETYKTIKVPALIRRFQIVAPPEPTQEEVEAQLQKQMTDAVQYALDAFAQTRGYDGIMSACSYANSTDTQFKLEAEYCIQLRDTTWRMGYAILGEVKAGTRPVPTVEELIAELPVGSAQWP